ncbi:MAG: hypothetical protein ACI8RZ_000774 [Myxococcota bacterium]|jgi:hypothetical protein
MSALPSDPKSAETLPLTVQILRSIEQLAASQRELLTAFQSGMEQSETQHREQLAETRALAEAIRLQTAALNARTDLIREIGTGILDWLKTRWFSILLGLAAGLGIAGARELIGAFLGQVNPPPPG